MRRFLLWLMKGNIFNYILTVILCDTRQISPWRAMQDHAILQEISGRLIPRSVYCEIPTNSLDWSVFLKRLDACLLEATLQEKHWPGTFVFHVTSTPPCFFFVLASIMAVRYIHHWIFFSCLQTNKSLLCSVSACNISWLFIALWFDLRITENIRKLRNIGQENLNWTN